MQEINSDKILILKPEITTEVIENQKVQYGNNLEKTNLLSPSSILLLKFPDAELNESIVKSYSSEIDYVKFDKNFTQRYCFVKLKQQNQKLATETICKQISNIKFGRIDKINVEQCNIGQLPVTTFKQEYDDIFTILVVENLPMTISIKAIKKYFPNSYKVLIDYENSINDVCNASVHFKVFDDALKAFKSTQNITIDLHKISVKFKNSLYQNNYSSDNENKAQQNHEKLINNVTNNDNDDDDVLYVCGETSKFENDNKANIKENANKKLLTKNNDLIQNKEFPHCPIMIKSEEYCDENHITSLTTNKRNMRKWFKTKIKDEPTDVNDSTDSRNVKFYNDENESYNSDNDYENDSEEVLSTPTAPSKTAMTTESSSMNWDIYRKSEIDKKEVKPSILDCNSEKPKTPFHIPFVASSFMMSRNLYNNCNFSSFQSHGIKRSRTISTINNPEKEPEIKKTLTSYPDELDELFERMNPDLDDDDFTF